MEQNRIAPERSLLGEAARQARILAAGLILALAAACTTTPAAELRAFAEAAAAAEAAARPIVADYAEAERAQRRRVAEGDPAPGPDAPSAAVAPAGLPPGAAAIESGWSAVGRYTETLAALAANRNLETARQRLHATLDALGGLAPETAGPAAAARPAAELLATALRPAVEAGNRETFRRIVLEAHPHAVALIGALRDFVPTQHSTTTSALQAALDRAPPPAERAALVARIAGWDRAHADYAALLDALAARLGALHEAAARPRARPLAERLTTGAAELRAYAEALRKSLAQLRGRNEQQP